jgi:hypothetical protein
LAATLKERRPTEWPLYWFAKLENAVEEGDHQAAAEAQRELSRLGVRVQFGRQAEGTRGARQTPTE